MSNLTDQVEVYDYIIYFEEIQINNRPVNLHAMKLDSD